MRPHHSGRPRDDSGRPRHAARSGWSVESCFTTEPIRPRFAVSRRSAVVAMVATIALLSFAAKVSAQTDTAEPEYSRQSSSRDSGARRVLVLIGPSNHPPGTHEVAAGGRLLAASLSRADGLRIEATASTRWPDDSELLEEIDTVVMIGDTFPAHRMPDSERIMRQLGQMMDRGCGLVCVHYATGLLGQDVAEDGDHPLLGWIGGYFANRSCPHHESIARIFPAAEIRPAESDHPILRGWSAFTVHDEPYIRNYFGKDDNRPEDGVTVLATSMLPPDAPQREAVAWCVERPDGGRGVGVVMPHFYENWANDDLRRLILNGVVWSAGVDPPAEGVSSERPDLDAFGAEAVRPRR